MKVIKLIRKDGLVKILLRLFNKLIVQDHRLPRNQYRRMTDSKLLTECTAKLNLRKNSQFIHRKAQNKVRKMPFIN